jgi:RimJ/RimL family protein N-acetyltransferase
MPALGEVALTDGTVSLREISQEDAELLYVWRMDVSSRMMFRHTEIVSFESHESMIQRYLRSESPDCWFIIEAAGTPVGTVSLYNFSDDGRICEWGRFTVAPAARNLGYGRRAMRLLMEYAHVIGVRLLTCEVLATNTIALHLYRELGFVDVATQDDGGRSFLAMTAHLPARA